MPRKIAVITGTRAEYDLLYWLIKALHDDPEIELQLIATCMHLAKEFGLTYQKIEQDGFTITALVDMLLVGDQSVSTAKSMGIATLSFADLFDRLQPDLVVLLGDRFEAMAVATVASVLRIPIAHIHGGEVTVGAIDDQFRHAITKLATFHFTTTNVYQNRVIQMGEDPKNVYCFGAPGVDNTVLFPSLTKQQLTERYSFSFLAPYCLINYYPETKSNEAVEKNCEMVLNALSAFPEINKIFTAANADFGGRYINARIAEYVQAHSDNSYFIKNFGQDYLSVLRHAEVVIGNSSSGIMEAPSVKTPTVNIGLRQKGRLCDPSVLNVPHDEAQIKQAITQALDPSFQKQVFETPSVYGVPGNVSQQIYQVLKSVDLHLQPKYFYDLPVEHS